MTRSVHTLEIESNDVAGARLHEYGNGLVIACVDTLDNGEDGDRYHYEFSSDSGELSLTSITARRSDESTDHQLPEHVAEAIEAKGYEIMEN
jgi:hypothetical protein